MAKGLGRHDLVQDLETGVRLECSGEPSINTRVFSTGRQEGWLFVHRYQFVIGNWLE